MADIVLRDRSGNPVEYPGIERIKLNTVDGEAVEFVDPALIPESVETTITPDFSGGSMEVVPDDGAMFSKVTVSKPATLAPEYIADGVNIAGIVGTLAAGGGSNVLIKKVTVSQYANGSGVCTLATAEELSTVGFDTSGKCFIAIMQVGTDWGYLSSPGTLMNAVVYNFSMGSGGYGFYHGNYNSGSKTTYSAGTITSNPFSGSMISNSPYYADGEIRYNMDSTMKLWTSSSTTSIHNRSFYVVAGNLTPSI